MRLGFSLILISILFCTSCQKETIGGQLDETIYVRHKGADMPAYVHGNSEEKVFLVVLHGAGSFGLSFRDENFINRIEDKYAVVYFDQRGQSMAQGHYKKPDDLIDLMSSDVEALIKVLKHKYGDDITLFLMGHSWGGLLSAATLLRPNVQNQFKGWFNVCGLMDLPSASFYRKQWIIEIAEEQSKIGNSSKKWEEIINDINPLDPESDKDYEKILQMAARSNAILNADNIVSNSVSSEKLYQTIIKNNPISWQVSHFFNKPVEFAKEVDYSVLNRLNEITIPVFFVYGKYDLSVPPTSGDEAFDEIGSNSKIFKIYERSMHHPFDSESSTFRGDLLTFIRVNK